MSNYPIKLKDGTETEFVSVTTVLKLLDKSDALIPWALNQCEEKFKSKLYYEEDIRINNEVIRYSPIDVEIMFDESKYAYKETSDKALDTGSEVHNLIEIFIKEAIKENTILLADNRFKNENIFNGYCAFLEWQKENIKTWIETEKTVYSLQYGYAGTLDAKALFNDNKIRIIDFKTSKAIYDDYIMQIAAYKYAEDELSGIISDGMGILRLDKETGISEWKDFTNKYKRNFDSFITLLNFYYLQKDRRLKNNSFVNLIKDKYKCFG